MTHSIIRQRLPLLALILGIRWVGGTDISPVSDASLERLVNALEGGDTRLVRWDASVDTRDQQEHKCSDLMAALDRLVTLTRNGQDNDTTSTTTSNTISTQILIGEYATFCITDNPTIREAFSHVQHIHDTFVNLVQSNDPKLSAVAAHVVYNAVYANTRNHRLFHQAGVVPALANIIQAYHQPANRTKDTSTRSPIAPVQAMWAAAALQNMAASYCETPDDGKCYWGWYDNEDYVVLTDDSQPLVSSGNPTRRDTEKEHTHVIQALLDIVCTQGPSDNDTMKFPGEDALAGVDDGASNIVTWAAAGAIKNLVLRNEIVPLVEPKLACFCRLHESEDWLESLKAGDVLQRLRRDEDPCHYDESEEHLVCVDKYFYTGEVTCGTLEDCEVVDEDGLSASEACCKCGGGERLIAGVSVEGEGDLFEDDEEAEEEEEEEEEEENEENEDEEDDSRDEL